MNTQDQVTALPCPFCGMDHVTVCQTDYLDTPAYAVSCRTRDCHGEVFSLGYGLFPTAAEAIATWNQRAAAPVTPTEIAAPDDIASVVSQTGGAGAANVPTPHESVELAANIMAAIRRARFPKEYAAEAHDEFESSVLTPMLVAAADNALNEEAMLAKAPSPERVTPLEQAAAANHKAMLEQQGGPCIAPSPEGEVGELIEQLREAADDERDHAVEQDMWHEDILREAADKLERLQAEITRLRKGITVFIDAADRAKEGL